jgi:ankyrin repeat protein
MLLKNDADINIKKFGWTALIYVSVKNQNEQVIDILLKHAAEVNIKDNYGQTAIILAFKKG